MEPVGGTGLLPLKFFAPGGGVRKFPPVFFLFLSGLVPISPVVFPESSPVGVRIYPTTHVYNEVFGFWGTREGTYIPLNGILLGLFSLISLEIGGNLFQRVKGVFNGVFLVGCSGSLFLRVNYPTIEKAFRAVFVFFCWSKVCDR